MKINNEDIYFVGVLQDLGIPYSSLYVDKENRELFLFVRVADGDCLDYLAANVSANDVKSYMNENIGLIKIFENRPLWHATIDDNDKVVIDKIINQTFVPNEKMRKMDMFDPELCDDDIWLDTFLDRINNGKPIEVA